MFKKLFSKKSKDPNSKQYRREMARQMSNHHIRYVTEKRNGVDEVIGRNGGLNIRDDELLVFASSDVIFRCKIDDMQIIAHASAVGCIVIITKYGKFFTAADRSLRNIRHEIVRNA